MLEYLMALLYPRNITCVVCNEESDDELCDTCKGSIQFNISPTCEACGRMIFNNDYPICLNCRQLDRAFDRGISVVTYDDYIKKLLFNLKYYEKKYIAHMMATYILRELIKLDIDIEFDYIVPVPLHKSRQDKRGFNQAELISKFLSELSGVPINTSLKRVKATKPLNKLTRDERVTILQDAFEVNGYIKGNIILVDDIFTTGTTINSCSMKLKEKGVETIVIATFAVGE